MLRPELIVAGSMLAIAGLVMGIVGYNKMQPTPVDNLVAFVEKATGQEAPTGLKSSKSEAYMFLGLGGLAFIGGIGLILNSRAALTDKTRDNHD